MFSIGATSQRRNAISFFTALSSSWSVLIHALTFLANPALAQDASAARSDKDGASTAHVKMAGMRTIQSGRDPIIGSTSIDQVERTVGYRRQFRIINCPGWDRSLTDCKLAFGTK